MSTQSSDTPKPTLWSYVTGDIVETALFTLRMTTIVSTFIFIFGSFGYFTLNYNTIILFNPTTPLKAPVLAKVCIQAMAEILSFVPPPLFLLYRISGSLMYSGYLNAMRSAFLTFALRLYQRKQEAQVSFFSKEMYGMLSNEDSAHYMLYTFFFYNQMPTSIYILPPLLYAMVFTYKYTDGMKQYMPQPIQNVLGRLNELLRTKQRDVFRFIAYTEIFIFLVILWNVITGYMFFLAPLLYYFFLKSRYLSKRNHYVRISFSELRFAADQLARSPRCPSVIGTIITRVVSFISQLAPVQQIPQHP